MGPAESLEPLRYAGAHSQTVNTLINETWSLTTSVGSPYILKWDILIHTYTHTVLTWHHNRCWSVCFRGKRQTASLADAIAE